MVPLNVLDQSPVPAGFSPAQAFANTVDLARHAEALGYHRYWLAEHHNSQAIAGSAPEILIGHVASATSRIRVGSGGVMLSHYSALKVVENFQVLEALHPGRIDLGIGRAPGSDQLTARALQRDHRLPGDDEFAQQVAELAAFRNRSFEPDHPFAKIQTPLSGLERTPLWFLGSSSVSALYAAELGAPYCFAHFIHPTGGEDLIAAYRSRFKPSDEVPAPKVAIAVHAICAPTQEEADAMASSIKLQSVRSERGEKGPLPSAEEAMAIRYTPEEEAIRAKRVERVQVGTPAFVAGRIEELVASHGAEECFVLTVVHDHEARKRSYELIAAELGVSPLAAQPAG